MCIRLCGLLKEWFCEWKGHGKQAVRCVRRERIIDEQTSSVSKHPTSLKSDAYLVMTSLMISVHEPQADIPDQYKTESCRRMSGASNVYAI